MADNSLTTAWKCYSGYCQSNSHELVDGQFETIWSGVSKYVRSVIRSKAFTCSQFDLDDRISDVQLSLWQRMRTKKLPCKSLAIFVASLKVVTRQLVIDAYRTAQADERGRSEYAARSSYEFCSSHTSRLSAMEVLAKYKDILAAMMVEHSRFSVVNFSLAKEAAGLFLRDARFCFLHDIASRSGFWDPGFLVGHLQVIFRWAYYDLRESLCEQQVG